MHYGCQCQRCSRDLDSAPMPQHYDCLSTPWVPVQWTTAQGLEAFRAFVKRTWWRQYRHLFNDTGQVHRSSWLLHHKARFQ